MSLPPRTLREIAPTARWEAIDRFLRFSSPEEFEAFLAEAKAQNEAARAAPRRSP